MLRKLLTWAKITEECSPTCQQLYFTVVCGTKVPSKSSIKMLMVSYESHFSLHCESLHGEVKNEKQTLKTVTMSKCMANSTAYGNLLCAVAPYCQTMLEELQADESRFYSMCVSRAQGKSVTGFSTVIRALLENSTCTSCTRPAPVQLVVGEIQSTHLVLEMTSQQTAPSSISIGCQQPFQDLLPPL